MTLRWTRRAVADRRAIYDFVEADDPSAAIELDELFTEKAAILTNHPAAGRPGRVPGTRELVVHRSYIVIYDVSQHGVRILRVLHAARQWPYGIG